MRVIMPRFSHRLALKIVLPFAALTLAIGAVGTLTATGELSSRSQGAFDAQLVHDGFVAQSMIKTGDTERQAILRLLTAGTGLGQNWDKTPALQAWLERALTIHPNVIVEVVDTSGREIVGVVGHGKLADTVTQSHVLSGWPGLSYMLSGGATAIDLVASAPQPAIFTGQPVRNATNGLIGAILVGDYLDDRAGAIKASLEHDDITFYDVNGQVLATSLSIPPSQWSTLGLEGSTRGRVSPTSVVELSRTAGGPGMEILSPWTVRTTNLGYIGTVSSTAPLLADTNQLRIILVTLFLAGVLFTLAIGIWLARRITRPVHRLVEATRLVSAGDLATVALGGSPEGGSAPRPAPASGPPVRVVADSGCGDLVNASAPAAAIAAAAVQPMMGAPVLGPGRPVVAAAMSRTTAMPVAVPSWAAVLMIPEAVPRNVYATVVPRVVEATEDRPRPAPAAATDADTAQPCAAAIVSAVSATAITASPVAIADVGRIQRNAGAARAAPATTARLNGTSMTAVVSGL